jgi:hypothetical protein
VLCACRGSIIGNEMKFRINSPRRQSMCLCHYTGNLEIILWLEGRPPLDRDSQHLSLDKDCPQPRRIQPPSAGEILAFPDVGGLHHRYERRAERLQRFRQLTHPLRRKGSLHFPTIVLTRNGVMNFHSFRTGHRPPDLLTDHEQVSATIIRRPFPTPNTFLSKNRWACLRAGASNQKAAASRRRVLAEAAGSRRIGVDAAEWNPTDTAEG